MTKKAYGIGYSGRTPDELRRIIEELDAILVDIRFAPYSRNPALRKAALQQTFGERYLHLQAFGNRNYKGGPVDLVDYEAGKVTLETLNQPALLMCMCPDPTTCHRTVVLRLLGDDGFEVEAWDEHGAHRQLPLS